ncbi:MAG: class I SAM-dependent methyltransferase [Candidatus Helarchaeota archaeon]
MTENYQLIKGSAHYRILELVEKNKKILDVGCGVGRLGKYLSKNSDELIGIDINKNDLEKAKKYYNKTLLIDVEKSTDIGVKEKYFDIIIFADILEHLKMPDKLLIEMKKYLKDDGYIIASIPNVAFYRNRIDLFLGKWEYKNEGILNIDHVRFFTLKSAQKLIKQSGFEIIKITYSFTGSKLFNLLRGVLLKFPSLFAFQFIIKAKKII